MDARQDRRYLRDLNEIRRRDPSHSPSFSDFLTGREVISIVNQRLVKVDGKVRTDATYPAGFMGEVLWTLRPPIREH
jgi:hypothetical protein